MNIRIDCVCVCCVLCIVLYTMYIFCIRIISMSVFVLFFPYCSFRCIQHEYVSVSVYRSHVLSIRMSKNRMCVKSFFFSKLFLLFSILFSFFFFFFFIFQFECRSFHCELLTQNDVIKKTTINEKRDNNFWNCISHFHIEDFINTKCLFRRLPSIQLLLLYWLDVIRSL